MADPIRFAVPNGSLQEQTVRILRGVGYPLPMQSSQVRVRCEGGYTMSMYSGRDDRLGEAYGFEFHLRDRNNIASLVTQGKFDAGITGADLRIDEGEAAAGAVVVCRLPYGRSTNGPVKWVLAVGEDEAWMRDYPWPKRVGAERVNLARHCLRASKFWGPPYPEYEFVKLPGKEESAIADGLCDAVFVMTETGKSLEAHHLEIICDNLFISTPEMLCSPAIAAAPERYAAVESLGLAMQAWLGAADHVTVTFDIPVAKILTLDLPATVSPTICQTLNPDWMAGLVLIARHQLGDTLRILRAAGARGIFMQDVAAYLPE